MSRKFVIGFACASLVFASLACQMVTGQKENPAQQPTVVEATQAVAPEPTATEDFSAATKAAEESAKATEEAKAVAATAAAEKEATAEAEKMLSETAAVEAAATAQAADMYSLIEELNDKGVLEKDSGTYYTMEDFEETWAQLGWYQWWNTGLQPKDFVVRAHTAWESASRTADWYAAGCGFVFRAKDADNHYMIYLALDGNVYLKGYVDGKFRELGKMYAGKIEHVKGEADVVLAVEGDRIVYYVNGDKVFDRKNSELTEGDLALTLVSGTNKDYGTRCKISDIEIWDLSE